MQPQPGDIVLFNDPTLLDPAGDIVQHPAIVLTCDHRLIMGIYKNVLSVFVMYTTSDETAFVHELFEGTGPDTWVSRPQ